VANRKSRSSGRGTKNYIKAETAFFEGRYQVAHDLLMNIPSGHSRFALAQKLLGQLEIKRDQPAQAAIYYSAAFSKLKTDKALLYLWVEACVAAGLRDQLCFVLEKITTLDHQDFSAFVNFGNILSELGHHERAVVAYKKALELGPSSVLVLSNLANLYAQLGERDKAEELLRKSIALDPKNGELYHDLSRIKKYKTIDDDILAMEKCVKYTDMDANSKMFFQFALAKSYDDMGKPNLAMPHLINANKIKKQSLGQTFGQEQQVSDQLITIFDKDFCQNNQSSGSTTATPVFVLGMPRSGTTLIEQILGSHRSVTAAGELDELRDAVMGMQGAGDGVAGLNPNGLAFPEGVASLTQAGFQTIGINYCAAVHKRIPEARLFTDKMPRNFFFLGLAALAMPEAKFIHCMRSPLDTCLSCFFIHFPEDQNFSYDLGDLGAYYQTYHRLMEHWQKLFPDRILTVRYEDVVENAEQQARKIINFCGLEWQPDCLNFHNSKRRVTTASAAQVREPIYTSSMKRWWKYRDNLGPLIDALGPLADRND